MVKIKIKCKCGKSFFSYSGSNRKYCSRSCCYKYRKPNPAAWTTGHATWNKGKTGLQTSYRKGKTWDSIWGKDVSKKMKDNLRKKKYKGAISINKQGYYRKRSPTTGKYFLIHQKVWKDNNNLSYIPSGYGVHHLDGNKLNNDPKNLLLLDSGTHSILHHTGLKYTDATKAKMSASHKRRRSKK